MARYSPAVALTWKGKLQVLVIKFVLSIISIIWRRDWRYPLPNFEENPRYFKSKDLFYLSYKYYHTQLKKGDRYSGVESYFRTQKFAKKNSSTQLTISLGGDLMPYQNITKEKCRKIWDEVGEFFFSSDIVFANLETPIALSKEPCLVPEVMLTGMLFNGNEEIFKIFNGNGRYKGFDVFSTCNNHSLDQQIDGLDQTLHFLERKKVAYCGTALSKEALHNFPIISKQGIAVAFIGFTFSLNKFDLPGHEDWRCNHIRLNQPDVCIDLIIQQATVARTRGADLIIASLHMGNAYQAYPSAHIQNTLHRICKDCGVDVIIGSHPHNAQPFEWYTYRDSDAHLKRALIFYSLGDLVAYDIYSWAHLALLVKLNVTKTDSRTEITGFEILPAYMLAEFNKSKITNLSFKHFETVYAEKAAYSRKVQHDLESVHELYTRLFSQDQRTQVIIDNDSQKRHAISTKLVGDAVK